MLEETKHRMDLLKATITDLIEIVERCDSVRFHMEATQFQTQASRLNRVVQSAAASSESALLQTSARFADELSSRTLKSFAIASEAIASGEFDSAQAIKLSEDLLIIKTLLEALEFTIGRSATAFTSATTPNSAPF